MHMHRMASFALVFLLFGAALNESSGSASPKSVAYGLVLDNSDMESLKEEITIGTLLVTNNDSGNNGFVVRYTNSKDITIVQDFTAQKAKLAAALDDMFAESRSPAVLDAIYISAQHLAGQEKAIQLAEGQRALVLIAHGTDIGSYYPIDGVLSLLREKRIHVYVIGVSVDEGARKFFDTVAKQSGGLAYYPTSMVEAETVARQILSAINK